jgi:hypothetical protein
MSTNRGLQLLEAIWAGVASDMALPMDSHIDIDNAYLPNEMGQVLSTL